jgi:hypothetical protein
VDIEAVKLLAKIGTETLGHNRLQVRWEKYLDEPVEMKNIPAKQLRENYIKAMADYPARFTGRAAINLAKLKQGKTIEQLRKENCSDAFLKAKGVHIDPFGNVFSGLCSGIIIGNINNPGAPTLDEIWRRFDPREKEIVCLLFESGPAALADIAEKSGYEIKERYADKCHLCTDVRGFLLEQGLYKNIIGPQECYEKK